MNAMIFAAGLGTRLKPYTDHCPKAMVEVAGSPMIAHQLLRLKEAGFQHVVINVHHYAQQIIDYVTAHNGLDSTSPSLTNATSCSTREEAYARP